MNEIDLVREALATARPTEQDTAAALARVRRDIDGGAEPRRARGLADRSRRHWIGGFGLTAVTAAAAVAVSLWGTSPGPDRHRAAPPPPAARTVLLAAARQADRQDDTMGEYWHDASVSRLYYRMHAPTGDYTVVWARRSEGWTPSDPAGRDCGRQQDLGTRPAGSADEAAWRRAGSPAAFTIPTGRKGFAPMTRKLAAGPPTTTCRSLPPDGTVFSLGGNVTMKDLRALPADPDRLQRLLIERFGRSGADTERRPAGRWRTSGSCSGRRARTRAARPAR